RPLVALCLGREGLGGGQRAEVGGLGLVEVVLVEGHVSPYALLSVRRAARSSAATSGASPASDATASIAFSASLADQPRPTRPCWTWSRHGAAATGALAERPPVGAPMRSLSSRMMRWAPFWPMPGTLVS